MFALVGLQEYAEPTFKPAAGELWLHFLMREHERSGSPTLACHTFKHGKIKGCLRRSEAIHLTQR